MFSALTKRNKILIIIGLILFVVAMPLTIIQVQKQQELRQRAAQHDTSLYFTKKDLDSPLTTGSLTSGQSDNLSLWIDTKGNSINGFSIAISATNLTFSSPIAGPDASSFNMAVTDMEIKNNNTLIFEKFDTRNQVIVEKLHLIDFIVTAGTVGNGSITVTSAKITPPKDLSQQYLSSENPSLSYAINAAGDLTPTSTPTPTTTPTPGSCSGLLCSGTCWDSQTINQTCKGLGATCSQPPSISFVCNTGTAAIPTPTSTSTPTPTSPPIPTIALLPTSQPEIEGTKLSFSSINLNGISKDPKTKVKNLHIRQVGASIDIAKGSMTHQSNGIFKGEINLPKSFTAGYYTISADNTLRKLIGLISPNSSGVDIPPITLSLGDVSGGDRTTNFAPDNRIDILDYNTIVDCLGARYDSDLCKVHPTRASADLDDDGTIDGIDYNTFLKNIGTREGD